MNKRTFLIAASCLIALAAFSAPAYSQKSQKPKTGENVAEVPALTEFHTVIFKIWHTAWPKKDVAMLSGLLPEIQKRADQLTKAKLPGILREKKATWEEGIEKLSAIIKDYRAASSPIDSGKLLDAAEQLHSQYERLVRTIHPVLEELENFHIVLYQLYHYDKASGDLKKIGSSVSALKLKMDGLDKAVLPERLKAKSESFNRERSALSASVTELEGSLASKDMKVIGEKIELMHSNYQKLERVFE